MSALGNLKVVVSYLRSGIDVNSKNRMNGWTALHWACVRGHNRVVETLIRAGADVYVTNSKGRWPIDVCKDNQTRELFRYHMKDEEVDAAIQNSETHAADSTVFVPNYMANPDLSAAWESPTNTTIADDEANYARSIERERSYQSPLIQATGPTADSCLGREFFVYKDVCDESHLLGSVFVDDIRSQKISELISQIRQELDDVPMSFSILRYNGQQAVPVGKKQEEFSLERVFRGENDAVVVKPKENSIHRFLN
ncbi:hypothetical protein LPJ64_001118 [Coemansia asiatica]|uniref:ANK_REP_REGION domain-containing protein n=1 Tax=Coemansia asiatica TaxID=1052880 RepID=A0A9W7XQA2_9FUNG|nr:hypothetical protein LPJ64_001118 [Coemansia asiatica]